MVEMDALGGTCLNRGCIPAKAFLETAAVHRHVAHAAEFGIEASAPSVNFAVTQERKNKIVAGLVGGIAAMCKGRKVEVFNGIGRLGPDHIVTVTAADGSTTEITGTNVILAAGSVPRLIPNFERGGPIMTSDEVLDLDHVPARMVVIGGGAIGCEFASTFADLGVAGDDPRGPAEDPARPRQRPRQRRRAELQAEEDRHPHRRDGQRPHAERPRRHDRALRRAARTSRSTPSSCRSAGGRSPTSSASTAPASRSTSAASSSSTSSAAPARTACTPSATSSTRRSWPTSATPRRSSSSSSTSARPPLPVHVRPGAVGDLLRPGGGVGRPRRGRGQGGRLRRRRRQAPVQVQLAGADPRRDRGAAARSSPRRVPTAAPGGSSACTWSGRG